MPGRAAGRHRVRLRVGHADPRNHFPRTRRTPTGTAGRWAGRPRGSLRDQQRPAGPLLRRDRGPVLFLAGQALFSRPCSAMSRDHARSRCTCWPPRHRRWVPYRRSSVRPTDNVNQAKGHQDACSTRPAAAGLPREPRAEDVLSTRAGDRVHCTASRSANRGNSTVGWRLVLLRPRRLPVTPLCAGLAGRSAHWRPDVVPAASSFVSAHDRSGSMSGRTVAQGPTESGSRSAASWHAGGTGRAGAAWRVSPSGLASARSKPVRGATSAGTSKARLRLPMVVCFRTRPRPAG